MQALGRKEFERAAEWLEKACVGLDGFLPWILIHPNPTRSPTCRSSTTS
jgi:hypothetical protein